MNIRWMDTDFVIKSFWFTSQTIQLKVSNDHVEYESADIDAEKKQQSPSLCEYFSHCEQNVSFNYYTLP